MPSEVDFDLNPDVQCDHIGHKATCPVMEPTEWISNMVIVNRPDIRSIGLDPKFLNKAPRRSHYIMPTLEDVLHKPPKARIFTLGDARNTLFAMQAGHDNFLNSLGEKRKLKLLFRVSVVPDVQQRKQQELLNRFSGIELIADGILVCGETEEEAESDHGANLLVLLERCWEVKLRLGVKKLQFKVAEVLFHGHILSTAEASL